MRERTRGVAMGVKFDHQNLDLPLRQDVLEVLQAALVGADPYRAVRKAIEVDGDQLRIGDREEDLQTIDHIYVVGAGKAAAPMAEAVEDVVGEHIADGVVAVKDRYTGSTASIAVGEAAHPVPDERSMKAARAVSHVADEAGRDDLVIGLMSGGGSSVLELPAGQLSLEDLQETTATLLASGLDIESINTVRKHLSSLKGGRLAEMIAPARHATIAISDVVGDPLDAIASGPTVPDPTTYRDALDVLEGAELRDRVPLPVVEHLEAGALGEHDETPDADHEAFERGSAMVAADRTDAVDAAAKAAGGVGYEPEVVTTELDGEARDVGRAIAQRVLDRSTSDAEDAGPTCLLFTGETTVTIQGRGKGGRNQELALSAAIALDEAPGTLDRSAAVAAFATDGTDGPTRAAGAIVGPETAERAREEGYDLRLQLRKNNSFQVLFAAGDLIVTGPTRTNVNDLICVLLD